jgi:hypothetical protein
MVASTARIREHESSLKGSSPAEEEEKAITQKKDVPACVGVGAYLNNSKETRI